MLDGLLPELLDRIVSHLDTPSALSLALVCKSLNRPATDQIWRHIDFSVTRARASAALGTQKDAHEDKAQGEDGKRRDLMARLEALEGFAGGRWRTVESFKTQYRLGYASATVRVLQRMAPTIRLFEITLPYDEEIPPWHFEGIDAELLECQQRMLESGDCLQFPSLTHITLCRHSITLIGAISLLLKLAPNLLSLAFCVTCPLRQDPLSFPLSFAADTNLSHLRLGYVVPAYGFADKEPPNMILDLIARSPNIQTLSASVGLDPIGVGRMTEKIAGLERLRDMYWDGMISQMTDAYGGVPIRIFARRLLLGYGAKGWQFPSAKPGADILFPNLEVVHIHSSGHRLASSLSATFPLPTPVLLLPPQFALWLSHRPRLRKIYFQPDLVCPDRLGIFADLDYIEHSREGNAIISSMRHGEAELLHVRLHLCNALVSYTQHGRRQTVKRRIIHPAQKWRGPHTRPCSGPAWQSFTQFDGAMVPLRIIEEMRRIESLNQDADWGRGVEVGAEAWKVLTDWREGQVPDEMIVDELDDRVEIEHASTLLDPSFIGLHPLILSGLNPPDLESEHLPIKDAQIPGTDLPLHADMLWSWPPGSGTMSVTESVMLKRLAPDIPTRTTLVELMFSIVWRTDNLED